ncbi:hypothetical protein Dsin_005832 [Dipteronia sinensis]|uniref:Uncharacterized protein n=1 Tax=Dipteronia sinensis TaxID=43782 RepID=A0AAE0EGV2_9ROSI|nr:hypothetical protein Dsin_005832 [Dipteronia sinensis]
MSRINLGYRPQISATGQADKGMGQPCCVQSKYFRDRITIFQSRSMIIEKGIYVPNIVDTAISLVIAEHEWIGYIAQPPRPNWDLVYEFYASWVPSAF